MNTKIQTVHFDADAKLVGHVNKRLAKLPGFHDAITKVEVYLKLENLSHQLKDKIAEIKVSVPQHQFFVKYESKSFEESFDHAFDALLIQIKREKEKKVE